MSRMMKTSRLAGTMAKIREKAIHNAYSLNEFTRGWSGILAQATKKTLKPDLAINMERMDIS